MATLVRSVMLGMKHAAPIMMKQGSGSIINNGSVAGRRAGYSTSMIYGAAKAAVNHLTVCAAMQLGEKNVRCNSISPGGIATGIFAKALGVRARQGRQLRRGGGQEHGLAAADPARRRVPTTSPRPRCSWRPTSSTFINGHDLVVDGGVVGGRLWTPHQQGVQAMRQAFGVSEGLKSMIAVLFSEKSRAAYAAEAHARKETYTFTDAWGMPRTWVKNEYAYLAPNAARLLLSRCNLKHELVEETSLTERKLAGLARFVDPQCGSPCAGDRSRVSRRGWRAAIAA